MEDPGSNSFDVFKAKLQRTYQHWLDRSVIHPAWRWGAFFATLFVFLLRIYVVEGWYIVTYGLGIFLLNNVIGFLSPQIDPDAEGPGLPTTGSDEFRPFNRRLPEFQFWLSSQRGVLTAFCMTLLSIFDIPVFWPILLIYFIILMTLTLKRQIQHMIKHKYVPWNWGKAKYKGSNGRAAGKGKYSK